MFAKEKCGSRVRPSANRFHFAETGANMNVSGAVTGVSGAVAGDTLLLTGDVAAVVWIYNVLIEATINIILDPEKCRDVLHEENNSPVKLSISSRDLPFCQTPLIAR